MTDFDGNDNVTSYRWWEPDIGDSEALSRFWSQYDRYRSLEAARLSAHRIYRRMYGPENGAMADSVLSDGRLRLNVVRATVNAVQAKVGKQRPRPYLTPTGSNPSQARRAKNLQRYLDAQFRISDYYGQARIVARDAALYGTTHLSVFRDGDKIVYKRVLSDEVLIDRFEARGGDPRTMFRRRWVSRDVLSSKFPDHADAIESSSVDEDARVDAGGAYEPGSDLVLLVEGIHLPSKPGAGDGKHFLAVRDCVLSDAPWKFDYHPLIKLDWSSNPDGYWGTGLAEELIGIQLEINATIMKIQAAMHLTAVPRVFVPMSSRIQSPQLDNRIGAIIPFAGTMPPIFHTPQAVGPEMFQYLWSLWQKAFEITGVSQLGATSQAPPGITSQVGLQTYHDIETERFSIFALDFEAMAVRVGEQTIDRAKEIAAHNPKYAAPLAKDRYSLDSVDWKEVNMEADEYYIQVMPASALPNDPAARQSRVESLVNAGLLPLEVAMRLLDFPDLEAYTSLQDAPGDLIDALLEDMVDEGEFRPPQPYMDLQLALKKGQLWYNRGLLRDTPDANLELVRKWLTQTHALMMKAQAEEARKNAEAAGMNQVMPAAGAPPAIGAQGAPPTAVQASDGV